MNESQIRENITIKPLAVVVNHNSGGQSRNYKTIKAGSQVNTVGDVALGVFNKSTGKPIGIAELSIFNRSKIKGMMELNCCNIDEELEE